MNISFIRRHLSAILVAGTLATTTLFGAGHAQASIVNWNIDATFPNDHATLSGSFQFNTSTNSFLNVDLTLSGSDGFGPGPFHFDSTFFTLQNGVGFSEATIGLFGRPAATIFLEGTDTFATTGPLAPFYTVFLDQCLETDCAKFNIVDTQAVFSLSGRAALPNSVVPVPAALPLFGTGLAILGFIGWRRKQKAIV